MTRQPFDLVVNAHFSKHCRNCLSIVYLGDNLHTMERFARIVVGYHGCDRKLADGLLTGKIPIADWKKSNNAYDWLGEGVYFWEHSPTRALRWATERFRRRAAVIGAIIQLGTCFDLLDEKITRLLASTYPDFAESFAASGNALPVNKGKDNKLRELDCSVINDCVYRMGLRHISLIPCAEPFSKGLQCFRAPRFQRRLISKSQFGMSIAFWVFSGQTYKGEM